MVDLAVVGLVVDWLLLLVGFVGYSLDFEIAVAFVEMPFVAAVGSYSGSSFDCPFAIKRVKMGLMISIVLTVTTLIVHYVEKLTRVSSKR